MPKFIFTTVVVKSNPWVYNEEEPDVSVSTFGLQLPDAVAPPDHRSEVVTINFTNTADVFSREIELLVPAVQHHDFLL